MVHVHFLKYYLETRYKTTNGTLLSVVKTGFDTMIKIKGLALLIKVCNLVRDRVTLSQQLLRISYGENKLCNNGRLICVVENLQH